MGNLGLNFEAQEQNKVVLIIRAAFKALVHPYELRDFLTGGLVRTPIIAGDSATYSFDTFSQLNVHNARIVSPTTEIFMNPAIANPNMEFETRLQYYLRSVTLSGNSSNFAQHLQTGSSSVCC